MQRFLSLISIVLCHRNIVKGTGECDFGVVKGRKTGVEEGRSREGVVLILSDRLAIVTLPNGRRCLQD